uniref:Disease resistance protein RPM1 n=1 Tax=Aegilops tauschii subsp. strangulata TaxID=200361 RepID=A0A453C2H5_AEGTS
MDLIVGASSNAVKSLVGKLGSLLAQEYTLIQGVRDDIQYINDELASMQAFLNRTKRAGSHDEQRQDWMKQVREVSYDIEDCVDDVNHRLGHEPRGNGKLMYIRKKWYFLTTMYVRRCIAAEIGNLKVRAQQVSDRRTRYGVDNLRGSSSEPVVADAPTDRVAPPPELIGTKQPVGVEDAMNELGGWFKAEQRTTQQSTEKRFLAIFGFGGLGKTTLAMELYRRFGDDFDCRASVQASQKFNLLMILRSLVKQFHEQQAGASLNDPLEGIEEWGEKDLRKKLVHQLKDKRYLVLIDDIWSVSAWENINDSLPERVKCGSVVVTTRFKSVAVACCRRNGRLYDHKPLLEENSYKLFRQIVSSAPDNASKASLSLLKKCGGLPLAIIVVAGLVASKLRSGTSSKPIDNYLAEVDKALSGGLETHLSTEGVTKVLDQCYNDLPADLKTCLLYLSMFPKGSFVSRKRLIRRWIGEGFIIQKHGKTIEEVAEDYFNELISRNLIRAVNNSSNGKVKTYQIHDMVLEYIVSKSSDENFITVVGGHWQTPFPSYKVRRLSIHRSAREEKETVERMKLSHVRSLTAFDSFKALHSCLLKFQILQVLDLESCRDLSSHQLQKICKMHQLKYLSLRRTDIEEIPAEIGKLEYLEVFDIRETEVSELPQSVGGLKRMTHLLAGNKSKRKALIMTEEITKMTALKTLSGMGICGTTTAGMVRFTRKTTATGLFKSASRGSCKQVLQALEKLTNLKKLSLYILGKLEEEDEILLLSAIEHLSSCSLKFLAVDDGFTGFLEESLSSSKAPPEHLHTLELCGNLFEVPKWIVSMHGLEKLTLSLTSLRTDTLMLLSELPELFSLTFSLDAAKSKNGSALEILHKNTMNSGGEIFVPDGGFGKLKLLRLLAPFLPPLSFVE